MASIFRKLGNQHLADFGDLSVYCCGDGEEESPHKGHGEGFIVGGRKERSRLGFWIGSKVRKRRRKGNEESRVLTRDL